MPRSGRLRTFIREYSESSRAEKISFIPPFLILVVEVILLTHAFTIDVPDIMVVELTAVLLIISIVEILLVSREIHEHYTRGNFDRILTIKLDDFIIERSEGNVKKIVTDFIEQHPKYSSHRSEIYHTTCQILETHKEEAIEKDLTDKLKIFIRRKKKAKVDDVVESFVKKYPKYKRHRSKIYEITCQILVDSEKKHEK